VLDLGARDVVLSGGERTAMEISHEWSGAKSWNTWDRGAAHRYCLETELRVGEKMRDVVYSDFGWREVSVKDGRLLLNGRPFKFWALRWEPVDVSPREGAELLLKIRGASLNALHPHYGTLPEEVYERADEMGFAVVPELHCCGKWNAVFSGVPEARAAAFFEAVFRTWYEELFNHPSIVTWCQEDLGAPLAREACARTLGADPTRPVMYRDLLPLVYDDALACMNFQELQKEKRSLFIQEFHQEREELIPPEARTLFLERLDGALFTTGFLGAPLMGRLFDGLLPAGGGQGPPLRARVVVKSSGAGGLLYLEDGARPGVLDGYVEESRTDLGFRAPGTLRLGKFPSPAAPIRIAPASARSGTVSPLEVALPE